MIVGVVLGMLLVLTIGATRKLYHLGAAVGRYQVSGTPEGALVIDTVTGRVWTSQEKNWQAPKLPFDNGTIETVAY